MKNWEEDSNKKAISFFKIFIRKVLKGKIEVLEFGWWPSGFKDKYRLSLTWREIE